MMPGDEIDLTSHGLGMSFGVADQQHRQAVHDIGKPCSLLIQVNPLTDYPTQLFMHCDCTHDNLNAQRQHSSQPQAI